MKELDVVDDVSVRDVNVEVAVVVDVEHLGPEAERDEARAEPRLLRRVLEQPAAEVGVQGIQLLGEVGDEDVGKAVALDVPAIDAHAGLGLAVAVEADARRIRHVGEGAVAVVLVEEVPHHVVGDVDVGIAVAVEVAER